MDFLKKILKGKRKIIFIPILLVIFIAFFPILIGVFLFIFLNKKMKKSKLKTVTLGIVLGLTLFTTAGYLAGMIGGRQDNKGLLSEIDKLSTTPTSEVNSTTTTPLTSPSPTILVKNDDDQEVLVTRVVDGDTIEVLIDNKLEKIRIIGIDTPELSDTREQILCFANESKKFTQDKLLNQLVWLEADLSQGNIDKYGRLLRFVWINNQTVDFGKEVILKGFGYEYTYSKPYKYQSDYKEAQVTAKNNKVGLWGDTICQIKSSPTLITPSKISTITPTTVLLKTITNTKCKYSCDGPDRDCNDFSSHAEAQEFFECCGFSATNDPMRLDNARGVGNGLACEGR